MTALAPLDDRDQTQRPTPADRGGGLLRGFDLLDRTGVALARFSGVALPDRPAPAPRIDSGLLRAAAGAIARDPAKRRAFLVAALAVAIFSATVTGLLASGHLGSFYELVWTHVGGRPWTHIMRDHPVSYAGLAVTLTIVPFVLAPEGRWGRAFLTYVIFWVGFLGGHVFW
ncbi:MAG: hypothetical protein ABW122_08065 [Ilumatobacteraceae bacterium]